MTRPVDPDNENCYVSVCIPSTLEEMKKPEADILRELRRCGYGNDTTFAIKLTLEESLTNAVKHGNRSDPSKCVTIRYAIDEDKACFVIRDEGGGFDPNQVPDPTAPERLSIPSGRGIMLMRAYMDRVEFRDNGREVFFMKCRCPQDGRCG